ncbi:hypothetical protein ACOSP7_018174 [Xanthoceras sorbifolium]
MGTKNGSISCSSGLDDGVLVVHGKTVVSCDIKCVNNLSILISTKITAQIELTVALLCTHLQTEHVYEFRIQANLKNYNKFCRKVGSAPKRVSPINHCTKTKLL